VVTGGSARGGAPSIVFEEGDGFCTVSGAIETDNAGYLGDGYANTTKAAGTTVVSALDALNDEAVTRTFAFANRGTGCDNNDTVFTPPPTPIRRKRPRP